MYNSVLVFRFGRMVRLMEKRPVGGPGVSLRSLEEALQRVKKT
jgi:hypothetical protein